MESNGRGALIKLILKHAPEKTKTTAEVCLKGLLAKFRGIVRPECTNKNYRPKPFGAPTSSSVEESKRRNAIANPIYQANPIFQAKRAEYRAKRKAANINEAMDYFAAHPEIPNQPLTDSEVQKIVEEEVDYIKSLMSLKDDAGETLPFPTFYVGQTKRSVKEEESRWLTRRGANMADDIYDIIGADEFDGDDEDDGEDEDERPRKKQKKTVARNRPVLINADGTVINKKNGNFDTLEFQSIVLTHSKFLIDATRIEERIQGKFHHLELGSERLWRVAGAGRSNDKDDICGKRDYKVFLYFSREVQQHLEDELIVIQKGSPKAPLYHHG
jgi:hypothetical protein